MWRQAINPINAGVSSIHPLLSPATVCVTSEIVIIDPDDGLSPDLRQAIISTNAVLLLIGL